jgi:glycerol-3-phosphate dehydrogenase
VGSSFLVLPDTSAARPGAAQNTRNPHYHVRRDIDALEDRDFDVLVVGGGIVGAFAAWDAALRGLSVALVERADFAAGASSNSLKFLHGGLRYLQKLELRSMREAVRERSIWLRNAPHLVHPIPVLVPLYGRGLDRPAVMRTALALNDLCSLDRNRGLDPDRRLPSGARLSAAECLELAPDLHATGLLGGVVFHDAQMYSSERLVLEVVQGAVAAGAVVANYVECVAANEVSGRARVRCVDRLTGADLRIRARTVINATGAEVFASAAAAPRPPLCRYSVAVNLMLRDTRLRTAVAVPADPTRGGARRLLAVPWRGRTMIGTAHYALGPDPEEALDPQALAGRFLGEIRSAFAEPPISSDDVVRVHVGLLPLEPGSPPGSLALMRRSRVIEDRSPFVQVVSVKFTTARAVAAAAVDRAVRRSGRGDPRSRTAEERFPHAPATPVSQLIESSKRARPDVPHDVLEHLVRCYGTRADAVMPDRWSDTLRIVPGSPVIRSQFEHALRHEMAVHPGDLVDRRTELGAAGQGTAEALRLAERMINERSPLPGAESIAHAPRGSRPGP